MLKIYVKILRNSAKRNYEKAARLEQKLIRLELRLKDVDETSLSR